MTQKDKQTAKAFMDDFWKYFRHYLDIKDNDEFWDEVIDNAKKLMDKYENDPVYDNVVLGLINGLDEKWKEMEVDNG